MNKTGRIVLGVTSGILIAISAAMLVATVALAWLYGTHRDPDGFVTGPLTSLSSDGYAISSADIDLEGIPANWVPSDWLGTFRIEAASDDGSALFVGIGPRDRVHAYLDDVEHSDVVRFGLWSKTTYTVHPGTRSPQLPATQSFWTATAQGSGTLDLDWEPSVGSWSLVVMNDDASAGVDISASIGVDNPWLPVGIPVVAIAGLISGALAAVAAVFALRRPRAIASTPAEEPRQEPISV